MNKHHTLTLALAALSLPMSATAQAEYALWDSNRLYVGGTAGVAHGELSEQRVANRFAALGYEFDVALEDRTRWAWGALAGYQWSEHFATELGFVDMGSVTSRLTGRPSEIQRYLESGDDAHPQSLSGWELTALGRYPLGERYYLYGRAGVMFGSSSTRAEQVSQERWNRRSEGPTLGLGVGYHFNQNWRARLGLSYYDLDRQRTTLAGLSLIYQLGEPATRASARPEPAARAESRSVEPAPAPATSPKEPKPLPSAELTLTFAYNSTEVREEFKEELQYLAEQMRRHPEVRLQLSGHSDNWGPSAYNKTLSSQRAQAVRDFMVTTFDLAPERFVLRAYGETRPFTDNSSEEGRSLNRRVELEWLKP